MSVDIPQEIIKKSFQASLKLGDVFLKNFEGGEPSLIQDS